MDRPLPQHIRLSSAIKQLRVERHRYFNNYTNKHGTDGWCIWLMANKDFSIGTYLLLLDNGQIKRVTIQADGTEHIFDYSEEVNG
jgi:ABC-type amino acid transport substrate-binding protein